MTKAPAYCVPADSTARVAKIMKAEDVGSIPVCDSRQSRRLIGIVTDRDLTLQVVAEGRDASGTTVEEVMTRDPITCWPEDSLQQALHVMQTHQVRRIPVIDRNGQLVGIIAQADIARRREEPQQTAQIVEGISRPSAARAG